MVETTPCLYCQSDNTIEPTESEQTCHHCGMPLPQAHPENRAYKSQRFVWAFIAIVIFCVVMIVYLPR